MEVSTHDNVSYDNIIVMVPAYSKGINKDNKEDNSESNKAPPTCDAVDSTNQVENDSEELHLYEIPNHEFSATLNSRDAEESYIYY